MLTESEVRDLLAKAAATIDVSPGAPVPAPPHRRASWWMPVLAACVVGLVVAAAVLVGRAGQPGGAPSSHPTNETGPVQVIPRVTGLDRLSATRALTAEGLQVTTATVPTCSRPGQAIRTRPAAGTTARLGAQVVLLVTRRANPFASCSDPEARPIWTLIDFANGVGPAPRFARKVTVYDNDQRTVLTASEAATRASWPAGSPLRLIADASRRNLQEGTKTAPPFLAYAHTTSENQQFRCGFASLPMPPTIADRPSEWFGFESPFPTDGIFPICPSINLFSTNGAIDAIVVFHSPASPAAGPDRNHIATQFLNFARTGSHALPVSARVRLYVGNKYVKSLSGKQAERPQSWSVCTSYAQRSCPLSAVATLRAYRGRPAVHRSAPAFCLDTLADPPTDTVGSEVVVLTPSGSTPCLDKFAVQIWYRVDNGAAVITAVNLLLGSP